MQQKLTDITQLALLKAGDILYRFPVAGLPETIFDRLRHEEIIVYKVKSINKQQETVRLSVAEEGQEMFTWPGDVEYLNINTSKLIAEGVWWV